MYKKFLLYLVSISLSGFVLDFCFAATVKADTINTSVNVILSQDDRVLGVASKSEGQTDGIGGLDIKNTKIESVVQGGNIQAQLNLVNLSESEKSVDKVELVVTRLDGTVELSESLKTSETLVPQKGSTLNYEFPGNLESGDYLGTIQLYSLGQLVGKAKTTLRVSPDVPQVLGASAMNYDYFPVFLSSFALILAFGVLMFVKRSPILQTSLSLKLIDVIAITTGVSAFGFGIFGGYILARMLFH